MTKLKTHDVCCLGCNKFVWWKCRVVPGVVQVYTPGTDVLYVCVHRYICSMYTTSLILILILIQSKESEQFQYFSIKMKLGFTVKLIQFLQSAKENGDGLLCV